MTAKVMGAGRPFGSPLSVSGAASGDRLVRETRGVIRTKTDREG